MFFASDNTAGIAPGVMAALVAENAGYRPSYGGDDATDRATGLIRQIFDAPGASVHFVTTGTAANALALAAMCPPWGTVFCHDHAHIHEDECGAPEFYTHGAKLVPVPGAHGRMDPAALADVLARSGADPVHAMQRGALSLTNLTEAGTLLTAAETAALTATAKGYGLPVHLDGSRLANALATTGAAPADLTWRAGVDMLSLGATKGGCMGVEAVVCFDPRLGQDLALRRKRGGHLISKHRFLAAQMLGWLGDGLWLDLAAHANAMAARLAQGLTRAGVGLTHPVQGNILFADWPAGTAARLRAAGAMLSAWDLPDGREGARLVTSWATTADEVNSFLTEVARG